MPGIRCQNGIFTHWLVPCLTNTAYERTQTQTPARAYTRMHARTQTHILQKRQYNIFTHRLYADGQQQPAAAAVAARLDVHHHIKPLGPVDVAVAQYTGI